MDKNGYNPSIVQGDMCECYYCGRRSQKLDRHEIFGGPLRAKSKALGLWVMLCHESCHLYGVHLRPESWTWLKQDGQKAAMARYGWTVEEFIAQIGRNYLDA